MIRLFVPDPLSAGAEIVPSPEQARYLLAVMRLGVGEALLLFNGRDGEGRAVVIEASKRACRLRVETLTRPQATPPDLDLIVALVKRARLETIVEKAAELGAPRPADPHPAHQRRPHQCRAPPGHRHRCRRTDGPPGPA